MKTEDLINWGEMSRRLSGSRQTIRKNAVPKIHQPIVKDLLKAIEKVLSEAPGPRKQSRFTAE